MPEGDTIHGLARRLRPLWQDAPIQAVRARELRVERGLLNRHVVDVHAWGKHLLVDFDDDTTLRIHLGIGGMMRNERMISQLSDTVALTVRISERVWTVRRPKAVDRFLTRDLLRHPVLRRLGPDLITDDELLPAVLERALERARRSRWETVAELLLDQNVAAGIGNVFRAEVLFMEGLDPFLSPTTLDDDVLTSLYERAANALSQNIGRSRNTTGRKAPSHYVYARSGRPCMRCEGTVAQTRLADRALFYCVACQRIALH